MSLSQSRHLSPEGKRAELAEFDRYKAEHQAPPDDAGGRGFPDPDILPWCDRLNALPGVCTLQSCAGHEYSDGSHSSGQLWICLSPAMARGFRERVFDLAQHSPPIERVYTLYAAWGQEIVDVRFAGNECGLLAESMELVVEFFSGLSAACSNE
jgi:hypothetical protein